MTEQEKLEHVVSTAIRLSENNHLRLCFIIGVLVEGYVPTVKRKTIEKEIAEWVNPSVKAEDNQ